MAWLWHFTNKDVNRKQLRIVRQRVSFLLAIQSTAFVLSNRLLGSPQVHQALRIIQRRDGRYRFAAKFFSADCCPFVLPVVLRYWDKCAHL